MSILYMEGFEQYSQASHLVLPYDASDLSTVYDFQSDTPFSRGQSLRTLQPAVNHNGLTKDFGKIVPNGQWVGQAAWIKVTTYPWAGGYRYLFTFLEGTIAHTVISITESGNLYPLRSSTSIGSNTARRLELNTWYHIEVKTLINDSPNGIVEIRVDGEVWGYWDNLDNRNAGSGTCNAVRVLSTGSSSNNRNGVFLMDSWVVWDGEGVENNDWAGSVEVLTRRPDSDVSLGAWTPNAGSAWGTLTEQGSDGDTSYIRSETLNDEAVFGLPVLEGVPAKIIAIQSTVIARKDDSGTRGIQHGVTINSVDALSDSIELGINYTSRFKVFEQNPDTESNWSLSDANSIQSKIVVSQ